MFLFYLSFKNHKGGRAPTLRLRFGKRSSPNWLLGKSNSQENVN